MGTNVSMVKKKRFNVKRLYKNWQLYLLLLPTLVWIIIFCYQPMYGVIIAFKDYAPSRSIMDSDWEGFKYFTKYFTSPYFWNTIYNTFKLSVVTLVATFPLPIVIALILNQFRMIKFKKVVQTIIYAPNFISVVIVVGMMTLFLSPHNGLINIIIEAFGGEAVTFMGKAKWFVPLFVLSDIWQKTGFSAVVYLAALSGVSPELHEAAITDGANKWQRIIHIDLPSIMPTAIILLILAIGSIMAIGGDKAYLMKNDMNVEAARTIFVYVTDMGIGRSQWSYATAIGLLQSVVNLILLLTANKISKRVTEHGLF